MAVAKASSKFVVPTLRWAEANAPQVFMEDPPSAYLVWAKLWAPVTMSVPVADDATRFHCPSIPPSTRHSRMRPLKPRSNPTRTFQAG